MQSSYVYSVGILAVITIVVWVFFAYNTFQPKNKKIEKNEKVKNKISHRSLHDRRNILPLRAAGLGQHNALSTSMSLVCFMSLQIWKT